jgi:hypothetical protein
MVVMTQAAAFSRRIARPSFVTTIIKPRRRVLSRHASAGGGTGFGSIAPDELRSPDGAERNPGTNETLKRRSRIALRSIRATQQRQRIKEAERRQAHSSLHEPHQRMRRAP